jgi:hypothetical protein
MSPSQIEKAQEMARKWMEDSKELKLPGYVIHSVESGSVAQMEGAGKYSFVFKYLANCKQST